MKIREDELQTFVTSRRLLSDFHDLPFVGKADAPTF